MAEEYTEEELRRMQVKGDVMTEETLRDDVQPAYFVTDDEKLLKAVVNDKDLKPLLPLYSRLLRLTKIDQREKELFQTDVDLIIGTMEADMDEDEYDARGWAKLQAHSVFLKTMINDSHKGFKMRLLSRLRKEIVFTEEEKKKRRRFGIF